MVCPDSGQQRLIKDMKLSELINELKDCKTDPEIRVGFHNRPFSYEVDDIEISATIKRGDMKQFNQAMREMTGPTTVVLIGIVPDRTK